MANELVVRRTQLPQSRLATCAAQYVRMSTDHQRYSVENQAAVIATYAQLHGLTIVRTYRDEGETGLKIKNRAGLAELLGDVQSGHADFSYILVYDISRWGRFQDTDESAHYEFLCKRAGIRVAYCAEQFENDGSLLSSIMKNVKRVMAAEYSRELSVKIRAGKLRLAAKGFRQGGAIAYGLRRELIDEHGVSKGYLEQGQQKNIHTDRVILSLGPPSELAVVRRIYRQYVLEGKGETEIARRLIAEGVPNDCGRWRRQFVHDILTNENYIGNSLYNRHSCLLREKKVPNPRTDWIKIEGTLAPVVSKSLFLRAQRMMALRYLHLSKEEMLSRLCSLWEKEGELSARLIQKTPGVPCPDKYVREFGSLRSAYRLIGYQGDRGLDWLERRAKIVAHVAADITCKLLETNIAADYDQKSEVLKVGARLTISFRVARFRQRQKRWPVWSIYRFRKLPEGLVLVIRLDEDNKSVMDYLLLPTSIANGQSIWLTRTSSPRFDSYHFEGLKAVTSSIRCHQLRDARASHASLTKALPPKAARSKGRPRKRSGRAQR
jgi:DNA invertase Pin-like site-specific DNA recombinase